MLRGASGNALPVLGEAIVDIQFGDSSYQHRFFVLPEGCLPSPVLIGLDFLKNINCVISTNPLAVHVEGHQLKFSFHTVAPISSSPSSSLPTLQTLQAYLTQFKYCRGATPPPTFPSLQPSDEPIPLISVGNNNPLLMGPNSRGYVNLTLRDEPSFVYPDMSVYFDPDPAIPAAYHLTPGVFSLQRDDNSLFITVPFINMNCNEIQIPKSEYLGSVEFLEIDYMEDPRINTISDKPPDPSNPSRIQALFSLVDDLTPPDSAINKKLKQLIRKFPSTFALDDEPLIVSDQFVHKIRTKDETPVYRKPYAIPLKLHDQLSKQIKEMHEQGLIRPSRSPFNSPIVPILKADGTIRICIDFRLLNAKIVEDRYPLPLASDLFYSLAKSEYFSTLDLKSGFHQIPLHEDSRPLTAFSTPQGKFEWCVAPMGISDVPAGFQRIIHSVLAGISNDIAKAFLDDLLITGKNVLDHLCNLETVIARLAQANLQVRLSKCRFMQTSIDFLGHVISKDGIKPQPKKVEAIRTWPRPLTVKDVQSFLGLANYYRKFIKDFSDIAIPLTDLTQGGTEKGKKVSPKVIWSKEAEDAFNALKHALSHDIILHFPDFDRPFELCTDASDFAVGGVLHQRDDKNRPRPLLFFSSKLSTSQRNFSTIEREAYAVIYGVRSCRSIIFGYNVVVKSDHRPLTWLFSISKPTGRLARWQLELSQYNLSVVYIEGQLNKVADALSRIRSELAEENSGEQVVTLINAAQSNEYLNPFHISITTEIAALLGITELPYVTCSPASLVNCIQALQPHTSDLTIAHTSCSRVQRAQPVSSTALISSSDSSGAPTRVHESTGHLGLRDQPHTLMSCNSPTSNHSPLDTTLSYPTHQLSSQVDSSESNQPLAAAQVVAGRRSQGVRPRPSFTPVSQPLAEQGKRIHSLYPPRMLFSIAEDVEPLGSQVVARPQTDPEGISTHQELSGAQLLPQYQTVAGSECKSDATLLQPSVGVNRDNPPRTFQPLSQDRRHCSSGPTNPGQTPSCRKPSPVHAQDSIGKVARLPIPAITMTGNGLVLASNDMVNVNIICAPAQGSLVFKYSLNINADQSLDLNEQDIPAAQTSDRICQLLTKFKLNSLSSAEHKELAKAMKHFDSYQYDITDGILYRIAPLGERILRQVYVPATIRPSFLAFGHIKSGHGGKDATFDCLQTFAFWESMHKDIAKHISSCITCIQYKGKFGPRAPVLKFNNATLPFERAHGDLVGPIEKSSEGYQYILTVIDSLSRFVVAVPLRSKKAREVTEAFFRHVIVPHGPVKTIVTDSGLEFTNSVFRAVASSLKTHHYTTPIYHPQSNGLAERANASVVSILRTMVADNPKTWAKMLPHVTIAYNQAYHHSVGDSPYFLLHLRDPPHPISALNESSSEPQVVNLLKYRELLMAVQQKAYDRVQRHLDMGYKQRESQHKRSHTPNITLGTRVYIYNAPTPGIPSKLQKKYKGPFRVVKVGNNTLVVRSLVTSRIHKVHLDNVKVFNENQLSEADHPAVRRAFPTLGEDLESPTPILPPTADSNVSPLAATALSPPTPNQPASPKSQGSNPSATRRKADAQGSLNPTPLTSPKNLVNSQRVKHNPPPSDRTLRSRKSLK